MPGTLTHSPADILRHALVDLGEGTLPSAAGAWPIHVHAEPTFPDNCITLYDTTGRDDGRIQINGERQGRQGFQVRVRSTDSPTGYTKADAIKEALDKDIRLTGVTISGTSYTIHNASRTGPVLSLGDDPESGRVLFTINGTVCLTED